MLERPSLRFGPWQPDPDGERTAVRIIRDAATGEALGLVCPLRADNERWWRVWSSPLALEFRETEDRALLMSLRPSRLTKGMWLIRDSDNNDVGRLRGDQLLDPWNNPFAERTLDSGVWTLREMDGRRYANCVLAETGDTIEFVDPPVTNPFLRMLTLATFALLRTR